MKQYEVLNLVFTAMTFVVVFVGVIVSIINATK